MFLPTLSQPHLEEYYMRQVLIMIYVCVFNQRNIFITTNTSNTAIILKMKDLLFNYIGHSTKKNVFFLSVRV